MPRPKVEIWREHSETVTKGRSNAGLSMWGGDPLAGGVHVNGARVRAAVGGDGAGADEGVDDDVELGGHGRDGDVGLHAVRVGVGAELEHLAALVALAPLLRDGRVGVAGEFARSAALERAADPRHEDIVLRRGSRRVDDALDEAQAADESRGVLGRPPLVGGGGSARRLVLFPRRPPGIARDALLNRRLFPHAVTHRVDVAHGGDARPRIRQRGRDFRCDSGCRSAV